LNENKEMRPSREEPEVSFSDLGDVTLTRARAIKLAGAALAGSAFSLLWAGEADAHKKKHRRKKKRRRRKAQVVPPTTLPVLVVLGDNLLSIKNPGGRPLTISGVKVLDSDGSVVDSNVLTDPVTIAPGETEVLTVNLDANDLLNADRLRLIDGRGKSITVIDENGVTVGDIDVL